jgi:hypothetical protein
MFYCAIHHLSVHYLFIQFSNSVHKDPILYLSVSGKLSDMCLASTSLRLDGIFLPIYVNVKWQSYPCNRPCETSSLPYFLDNRLTDCGEVVSLTSRPHFTPQEVRGTHFCQRLSRPQGHSTAGRIRYIEKVHLIGT